MENKRKPSTGQGGGFQMRDWNQLMEIIVLVAVWAILATLALMFSMGASKLRKQEEAQQWDDSNLLGVWDNVL